MKPKFLILLLFAVSTAFAQQTYLDFMNNKVPLFPGCADASLRYDCFLKVVGAAVADSVNGYHKLHPFAEDKLQAALTVVSKESGAVMLVSAKTPNTLLKEIADAAISKLPNAIPIYAPEGNPVSASIGFVLVLKKDAATGLFVQEYESKAKEWAAKPNPMPMPVVDAAFPGCKDSKNFGNCFEQQFNAWFVPRLSAAASEIKKGVVIRVTVNEEGKLHSYEVFTTSALLKEEADKVLKSFPDVTPSTVNGKPYKATYVFPLRY